MPVARKSNRRQPDLIAFEFFPAEVIRMGLGSGLATPCAMRLAASAKEIVDDIGYLFGMVHVRVVSAGKPHDFAVG